MYYIGIDVGGMSIKAGVADINGNVLHKTTIVTRGNYDAEYTISNDIHKLIVKLLDEANIPEEKIAAVGIGQAGSIDSERGIINYWNNIPMKNVHVVEELKKWHKMPVFIDNDANVAGMIAAQRWIMLAGTVLLAPLAEECFIRGLIFQGFHRKNRWAAYALSTLAFCCLHIYGYIGAYPPLTLVLCALDYVPAGIALAWSYEKADTIFAPILMHCLINALAFQALG